MPIDHLARTDVVTAAPETPVAELASMMERERVGSVMIAEGDSPVGIVTDRDIALRALAEGEARDAMTALDVMTTDLCTADPDMGFYEATTMMAEHGVRRLPVCDGDTLVGVITFDDLTELLADEEQQLAEVIRAQRPSY